MEKSFAVREVVPKGQVVCERRVRLASGVDHMILVAGESLKKLLPVDADLSQEITFQVRTQREVFTAPVIKGSVYGEMDVIYQGEVIGKVPLHAQSNIGLSRYLVAWDAVVSFFSHGPAKVILILVICAAVFYVLYLFFMLWVQYLRRNRERNRAIAELMEMENRRMRKVRLEERKANQARMRKVRSALRAGFQVLQGDAELEKNAGRRKKAPASRAVAKVPEKYRSINRTPQNGRVLPEKGQKGRPATPEKGQKPREVYRTGRPVRPASSRPSAPSQKASPPPQRRRGKK